MRRVLRTIFGLPFRILKRFVFTREKRKPFIDKVGEYDEAEIKKSYVQGEG